jgi:hypothetical protein
MHIVRDGLMYKNLEVMNIIDGLVLIPFSHLLFWNHAHLNQLKCHRTSVLHSLHILLIHISGFTLFAIKVVANKCCFIFSPRRSV